MFRENNVFMLVFDLSVAEVAEVAGFSWVRGVGCNNVCGWIKMHRETANIHNIYNCHRDM